MFFILSILLIIVMLIIILLFSQIKIILNNIKISNNKINGRHIQKDYQIIIKITLFKIIRILEINITKDKLERLKLKEKVKNIESKFKDSNLNVDINTIKEIKNIKFTISNLNLLIKVGTENAAFTAISTGVLSSIIGILLRNKINNNKNNIFEIVPVYINQNLLNINLNCIITIKMIHIIDMLYILGKRKRDDKYVRTSDRRSYAYSNE